MICLSPDWLLLPGLYLFGKTWVDSPRSTTLQRAVAAPGSVQGSNILPWKSMGGRWFCFLFKWSLFWGTYFFFLVGGGRSDTWRNNWMICFTDRYVIQVDPNQMDMCFAEPMSWGCHPCTCWSCLSVPAGGKCDNLESYSHFPANLETSNRQSALRGDTVDGSNWWKKSCTSWYGSLSH